MPSAEQSARRVLDRKMRRILGRPLWRGRWELFRIDGDKTPATWEQFGPAGNVAAVATVTIHLKKYWVQAMLALKSGERTFRVGPIDTTRSAMITFRETDPRERRADGTSRQITSREDLANLK